MPGTGDVLYVLGPVLVALGLGALILIVLRVRRRGPSIAPRSAPDHGLPRQRTSGPEDAADGEKPAGDGRPAILRALRRRSLTRP